MSDLAIPSIKKPRRTKIIPPHHAFSVFVQYGQKIQICRFSLSLFSLHGTTWTIFLMQQLTYAVQHIIWKLFSSRVQQTCQLVKMHTEGVLKPLVNCFWHLKSILLPWNHLQLKKWVEIPFKVLPDAAWGDSGLLQKRRTLIVIRRPEELEER